MGIYDEIMYMPRHVSKTRHRMTDKERAAQFAPFAALTGYEDVVEETGRFTMQRPELGKDAADELDLKLEMINKEILPLRITYFVNDERKIGGRYCTFEGVVVRIDDLKRILITDKGTHIPIDDIYGIEIKGEDYV